MSKMQRFQFAEFKALDMRLKGARSLREVVEGVMEELNGTGSFSLSSNGFDMHACQLHSRLISTVYHGFLQFTFDVRLLVHVK